MKRRVAHLFVLLFCLCSSVIAADFQSAWPTQVERVWAGPEYWANPLQDWRIREGRLENVVSGVNRSMFLLTHELTGDEGEFRMSVRLGRSDSSGPEAGWAGFRAGLRGPLEGYRSAAIRGVGYNIGITTKGHLFIGDLEANAVLAREDSALSVDDVELRVTAAPYGGNYRLTLAAHDPATGNQLGQIYRNDVPADALRGGFSLVSEWAPDKKVSNQNSYRPAGNQVGGNVRFWFRDWKISGNKVAAHPDHAWGPILWAQHTLSKGVMKMTVQMPPIGDNDTPKVRLEIKKPGASEWVEADYAFVHTLARVALLRVEDWDAEHDIPYRVAYDLVVDGGKTKTHYWKGTIRHDPVEKDSIVVGGFSCAMDYDFPHPEVFANVGKLNPDILFYTGDQIYEAVAGFGVMRNPDSIERAALDYLRKWYLHGWAFGDLMRDRPTVCMPDDHDVYQGNIWGGGGRKVVWRNHETGGYAMPAEWVTMVHLTQTSNLPDPYDPRPIAQGIPVYFTDLLYGRISFGVIEDRKFKSGPKGLTPPTGGRPDHVTDPTFDRNSFDPPGAKLLGDRQIKFIRDWTSDWTGSDMKVSVTQTIFSGFATNHGGKLERLVADMDSNGWPKSGRDRALRELRKGFTFLIGGDQHLPNVLHMGVDDWNDSGWSFCVPAISVGYMRSYEPETPGKNRKPGAPEYMGEHTDCFGSPITVHAVANPKRKLRPHPTGAAMDKSSGFGIVRLNRKTGKITMECWPVISDPDDPKTQFKDWPITIDLEDNYSRPAAAWLPRLQVAGLNNPVVQVIDESNGEIVYTLRIRGTSWRPKVFTPSGAYTVKVGEPGTKQMKVIKSVKPAPESDKKVLKVEF